MRKALAVAGAFLCSVASIAVWVELIRHVDVVVRVGFGWFGGLTGFTWHGTSVGKAAATAKARTTADPFGDDNKKCEGKSKCGGPPLRIRRRGCLLLRLR